MKFRLVITLGNDAMQTPSDVAGLLRALAGSQQGDRPYSELPPYGGTLRDANGNTVARWEVTSS
jgi:hypothetical protein